MEYVSDEELRDLILSVGTHRGDRRLSPVQVARLIQKEVCRGTSIEECAERLNIGSTQVRTFLKLLDLDPEIRHLAEWGTSDRKGIAFSSLAKLVRLPEEEQPRAAKAILENDLTWEEVVELVQMFDRSEDDVEKCVQRVLERRPTVEEVNLFIGSIHPDVKAEISALKPSERDEILRRVIKRDVDFESFEIAKLGIDYFSIVSEEISDVEYDPEVVEKNINKNIEEELSEQ